MPHIEAFEPIPGAVVTKKLDGVRVRLGRSLGSFEMPSGISVVMHTPMEIGEEIDIPGFQRILGQSNRLTMPFVFRISAKLLRPEGRLSVGTRGYHETNILHTFWLTHNQKIQVAPSDPNDEIVYNDTPMPQGFSIPVPGAREVVFEPIGALM